MVNFKTLGGRELSPSTDGDFPVRGTIWALPTGVTVALVAQRDRESWDCMVVASNHPLYPVGGYDITVTHDDIVSGRRLTVHANPAQ